tara:strand:+ start:110 stop:874 length:765 start_codon:yes stop_codon:yes gene_type:complete
MDIWDKILQARADDVEKYANLFPQIIDYILFKKRQFKDNVKDKDDYYLITEENRDNCVFIHIVPKELMTLFRQMQIQSPNDFHGYSVLAGRRDNKDLRVTCLGVPCSILYKSVMNNEIVRDIKQDSIKHVVLGMAFDDKERLLMIKTTKHPYEGHWTLPSGIVSENDTIESGVRKATYNQTGVKTEIVKETMLLDKFDRNNNKNVLIHFILCVALDDTTSIGSDAEDVRWFSKQDLLTIKIVPEFKKYVFDELF